MVGCGMVQRGPCALYATVRRKVLRRIQWPCRLVLATMSRLHGNRKHPGHINQSRSSMMTHRTIVVVPLVICALSFNPTRVGAEDIRGIVVRTLMLSEDSRLIGDVTCQVTGGPCIAFGASNISLSLNGFSI